MCLGIYNRGAGRDGVHPLGIGGEQLHEWVFGLAAWREAHGLEGGEVNENTRVMDESLTNIGATTSGVPTASLVETKNPEIGGVPAFQVTSNSCNVALPPGQSCALTVKFKPNSNAGDELYSSRLDVTATPGSTASSILSGMAN